MIDSRKRQEIIGIFVAFIGIVILLSLVSYSPSDPTLFGFSPSRLDTKNWMGLFGAHLARVLYSSVGFGSLILPVVLFRLAWDILGQRKLKLFLYVTVLILATLSVSILMSLFAKEVSLRGEKLSGGGFLGDWVTGRMIEVFSYPGTIVIVAGIGICAVLVFLPWTLKEIFENIGRCFNLFRNVVFYFIGRIELLTTKIFLTVVQSFKKTRPIRASEIKQFEYSGTKRNGKERSEKTSGLQEKSGASSQNPASISLRTAINNESSLENLFASSVVEPKPATSGSSTEKISRGPAGFSVLSGLDFSLPPVDILDRYENRSDYEDTKVLQKKAEVLTQKLADFGVHGEVINILPGPVITMFEYVPAPGIKISRIVNLQNDLTMALKALSIRIVAPIPGKAAVGIEIPNNRRQLVSIRSVIESSEFQKSLDPLTIALGKDTTGLPVVTNLAKMPHLLIAGATGTGKSVCLNGILASLLFRNTPERLRLLLIDPKRIELSFYEGIPHLIHPVVTEVKKATKALQWAVEEMERRYGLMAEFNARNIESFNKRVVESDGTNKKKESAERAKPFPYLVVIIDELADLMMVASREVEESITRLAQMARAAGIHLVLATQRPSVDVITGLIKANIPSRISFQVSSKIDSRTILDAPGAETLLGSGDMLFLPPGTAKLQRIHGAFISDREVQRITEFWREQAEQLGWYEEPIDLSEESGSGEIDESEIDEKYEEAVKLVLETRQASISMLQRRLRVGYNRAARMIELMEKQGIVGPSDGIKPREVLGLPGSKYQQS